MLGTLRMIQETCTFKRTYFTLESFNICILGTASLMLCYFRPQNIYRAKFTFFLTSMASHVVVERLLANTQFLAFSASFLLFVMVYHDMSFHFVWGNSGPTVLASHLVQNLSKRCVSPHWKKTYYFGFHFPRKVRQSLVLLHGSDTSCNPAKSWNGHFPSYWASQSWNGHPNPTLDIKIGQNVLLWEN